MFRYLILCLILSKLILSGCTSAKMHIDATLPPFNIKQPLSVEVGERVFYKTQIELYGRKFGGLLVILNEDSLYKVSFLSEMGIQFFDIKLYEYNHEVVYCFEPMNKKPFLDAFVTTLRLLLAPPKNYPLVSASREDEKIKYTVIDNDDWTRHYYILGNQLQTLEASKSRRQRTYISFNFLNNKLPESIHCKHKGFTWVMEMNLVTFE